MIKEYPIWFFSANSRRPLRLRGESLDSISSPQSRRDRRGDAENFKLERDRQDRPSVEASPARVGFPIRVENEKSMPDHFDRHHCEVVGH